MKPRIRILYTNGIVNYIVVSTPMPLVDDPNSPVLIAWFNWMKAHY
jgi:hypothetical protein